MVHFLNTADGLPSYGEIVASLTVQGDTSPDAGLAVADMPVSDAEGRLHYERTFTVPPSVVDDVSAFQIVQHGVDGNDSNTYDFDGFGPSDLDPTLPQEATIPANCGGISANGMTIPMVHTRLNILNDSEATGTARMQLDGDQLTVAIRSSGLTPGLVHAQHIHGIGMIHDMPVADANGNIAYDRTFTVTGTVAEDLDDLTVVQHGLDGNDTGTYDVDGFGPRDHRAHRARRDHGLRRRHLPAGKRGHPSGHVRVPVPPHPGRAARDLIRSLR